MLQDIWGKTRRLIANIMNMELEVSDVLESIKGFLVYVSRKYRYMNPYLKGFYIMLDSWRNYRDEK